MSGRRGVFRAVVEIYGMKPENCRGSYALVRHQGCDAIVALRSSEWPINIGLQNLAAQHKIRFKEKVGSGEFVLSRDSFSGCVLQPEPNCTVTHPEARRELSKAVTFRPQSQHGLMFSGQP